MHVPDGRPPPLSCDTHSHIYGDLQRYPVLDGHHTHPNTELDDYLRLAGALGIERHVFVQAKAYGTDSSCLLDAIARVGASRARGVIMPDESLSSSDLTRLDRAGIRGVRFLFTDTARIDMRPIQDIANQVASLGWSLLIQGPGTAVAQSVDALAALPCPVVIDHLGRLPPAYGVQSREFQALLRFVKNGGWMKLSAPYYNAPNGAVDFAIIEARIHAFLDAGRDRVVWGMNWPHPNFAPGSKPDDASALDSLLCILRSPDEQKKLFVDNPARLYGFAD